MAFVHPADEQRFTESLQAFLDGTVGELEVEHRVLHGDGATGWMQIRGVAERDAEDRVVRMLGSSIDITSQSRTAEGCARVRSGSDVTLSWA